MKSTLHMSIGYAFLAYGIYAALKCQEDISYSYAAATCITTGVLNFLQYAIEELRSERKGS